MACNHNCSTCKEKCSKPTNLVVKTLEENNTKITFFIFGEWGETRTYAVMKLPDAGHDIGTHGNTHPHVDN